MLDCGLQEPLKISLDLVQFMKARASHAAALDGTSTEYPMCLLVMREVSHMETSL